MKIKILLTVMSLLAITSCYEDKGNYDYREMNDIEMCIRDSHFNSGNEKKQIFFKMPNCHLLMAEF